MTEFGINHRIKMFKWWKNNNYMFKVYSVCHMFGMDVEVQARWKSYFSFFSRDHTRHMQQMHSMFRDPFSNFGMLEDGGRQGRERGGNRGLSNEVAPFGQFGFGNMFTNMSNMMQDMDRAFVGIFYWFCYDFRIIFFLINFVITWWCHYVVKLWLSQCSDSRTPYPPPKK